MGDEPDEGLPEANLFETLLTRRTCRDFTDQAVEWEKVCEVISAGMQAPSSGNLQNWSFIVVTEKPKLQGLYEITLEQEVCHTAQIGIIVCGDEAHAERFYGLRGKRIYTTQNCAACIQNMLLAAHALGLGACWLGAFDEEKVATRFSIPDGERAQAIILLGYPASEPDPKERKGIADLVYFNEYGQKVAKPHLILRDYSTEWAHMFTHAKERLAEGQQKRAEARQRDADAEELAERAPAPEGLEQTKSRLQRAIDALKDQEKLKRKGK